MAAGHKQVAVLHAAFIEPVVGAAEQAEEGEQALVSGAIHSVLAAFFTAGALPQKARLPRR